MQPAPPIDVIDLFAEMREQLLDLLASLSDDEWAAPTICAPWAVKDLTAHIIGDDLGVVSRGRDGYNVGFIDVDSYGALVAAINRQNEQWVCAMRHLSPGAIIEMLRFSDERAFAHFRSLDFDAIGGPVDWAGPEPAPVWLDVAREYTERWSHQQQIRDAVDKPGLKDRRFFAPLLDAYVRGVPHAFRDTAAPEGTHVRIEITGAERAAHGRSCAPTPAGRCTPASTRRRPRRQRSIKRRMAPVHERHDAGRGARARDAIGRCVACRAGEIGRAHV